MERIWKNHSSHILHTQKEIIFTFHLENWGENIAHKLCILVDSFSSYFSYKKNICIK